MKREWTRLSSTHLYSLAIMLITAILLASAAEGRIYKWVDETGKLHYSDTPPPGIVFDDQKKNNGQKKRQPAGTGTLAIEREAGGSIYNIPIHVEVAGTVQGQSGNSIDDVVMTVKVRHYPGKGFESETSYEKKKINSTFRVTCKNCEIVALSFKKDGYLPAKIKIKPTKEEKRRMEELLSQQMISQKAGKSSAKHGALNVVRKGLKAVLTPEGNAVRLIRLEQRISFPEQKPFLTLSEIPSLLRARGGNFSYASEMIRAAEKAPESLRITFNSSPNLISEVEQDYAAGISFYKSRVKVYLDFSSADGGVMEAHPKGRSVSENLARMTEAPKRGYTSRLVLSPDKSRNSTPTYFYFKFGGFYGKGVATSLFRNVDPKGKNTRVGTTLELYFNPEGGRNLLSR